MVHGTTSRALFLSDAINDFLIDFAMQIGLTSERDEDEDDDGQTVYHLTPGMDDCATAARQSVTVAAVLSDLCARMGITPPTVVTAALTDAPPY